MPDRPDFARFVFIASATILVLGLSFAVGLYSGVRKNFIYDGVRSAVHHLSMVLREVTGGAEEVLYSEADPEDAIATTYSPGRLNEGLLLVMGMSANDGRFIRVIDRSGAAIHEWRPDWFEIWDEDEGEFPESRLPKSRSPNLHGIEMLPSGDVVFNFEHLSTVRLNPCGEVAWKLDNLGHHAVHLAEDGSLWVAAETYYEEGPTPYLNHDAPLRAWTLQRVSPEGQILETIDMIDLLEQNDLLGLLFLSSTDNVTTNVQGDTLHLNDVDVFPSTMSSENFEPGDIMISLRNINTVLVIDGETHKVKFRSTGQVLRHHDPDFLPGDRISVFDNRNLRPSREEPSRIVEIDATTGELTVVVDGAGEGKASFSTHIMGTHQRLGNGNIMIVSSNAGKVLEVLPEGTLAWEYQNRVGPRQNGRVTMGMVLPPEMDEAFFREVTAACG